MTNQKEEKEEIKLENSIGDGGEWAEEVEPANHKEYMFF